MSIRTLVSPEELLRASVQGDRKSQELLYKQFFGFAMSICMRYTNSKDEALEVVNDGFLKVFTKGEQYDANYPFKAWLKRIMVNTALDYYRKYQKHYYHENIEYAHEVSSQEAIPISNLSYEELMELVKKLPPSYRMVFSLFAIEGYNHDEIAKQLGISEGTSKSNLSRARDALRAMLARIK